MEFTFAQSPWEQAIDALQSGDSISGAQCFALLEDVSEADAENALLDLEKKGVALDISDLPNDNGSGEAAVRLRLEQKLVESGQLLNSLDENDPLKLYLEEIAAIPTANVEALAERYAKGNAVTEQELVNGSLHNVVRRACAMTGRGVLLLDLIQEGSLGLWQGILCYKDGGYVNHINWWIDQYLAKAVWLQARSCGIGQKMRQGMEDYRDMDQRLLAELGRNPTLEEIAEAIHVSVAEATVYANLLSQAKQRQRVEQSRETKEETAEDNYGVEDTAYFQMRERISEMLSMLTAQEAKLLTLRFGLEGDLPQTPQQAGEALGMTPDEVLQTEAAALRKLRKQAE